MAHVERHLSQLSGLQVAQAEFLTIAAFAGPVVWLLGAIMLLKRWAFGYFFASTFLFGMMFAELSHVRHGFLQKGRDRRPLRAPVSRLITNLLAASSPSA